MICTDNKKFYQLIYKQDNDLVKIEALQLRIFIGNMISEKEILYMDTDNNTYYKVKL